MESPGLVTQKGLTNDATQLHNGETPSKSPSNQNLAAETRTDGTARSKAYDYETAVPLPYSKHGIADTTPLLSEHSQVEQQYDNLLSLFEMRCRTHANRNFVFYRPGGLQSPPLSLSYPSFMDRIREAATQLLQEDVKPGEIILIHLDNHYDNLLYWWTVVYAGFVPAMSTPLSNNLDQRRAHLLHLYSLLNNPLVLTRKKLLQDFSVQSELRVQAVEALRAPCLGDHVVRHGIAYLVRQGASKKPADLAALMLTSGSTGKSKAVHLTHGLILKSVSGKAAALDTGQDARFFNFIAADHVASLTEIHAHGVWSGGEQVYAEAADIVTDPLSFWRLCHKHHITHSFAPHFFLASLTRALSSADGIALRQTTKTTYLRAIVTGGEANVVDTCLALTEILQEAGAPVNCLKPAFGMTETSAGCIYSHVFPTHDVAQGYSFASLGRPIEGLELRIVDEDGSEIIPGGSSGGQAGMLQVRGEVVFTHYYNDPDATQESLDKDGWFNTGDQGMIDVDGQLCLTGRAKEMLIINGVNHSPSSVEAILDGIDGTVPSYTLVLPYRAQHAETESLCVVYLPAYQSSDVAARETANNAISTAVLLQVGVRPLIIPLDAAVLQKSTLGKLPRNKIRRALEAGLLEPYNLANCKQIAEYQEAQYIAPANDTEQLIIDIFSNVLDLQGSKLGATSNLFAIGVNSIDLITIKTKLETRLRSRKIPMTRLISSATARELAAELDHLKNTQHKYNPTVTLHAGGDKTPLWLIHPGTGEALVFLPLAHYIRDRPVYAMRARGFEAGEPFFASTADAVQTYYAEIRRVQPRGPYALAGYSFGSMLAFELAKLLRQAGEDVRFLAALNLPPHIRLRMRQLDWYNCLLHLSYFLSLISEEYAHRALPVLQQGDRDAALEHVLTVAQPERLLQLGLDADSLRNWVDLANSLQSSAADYEPSGMVDCMDIFYAVPLAEVAKDMDDWLENHLDKWKDFCAEQPSFHRVDGLHYTMIGPAHVHTFQKTLKRAMEERGL